MFHSAWSMIICWIHFLCYAFSFGFQFHVLLKNILKLILKILYFLLHGVNFLYKGVVSFSVICLRSFGIFFYFLFIFFFFLNFVHSSKFFLCFCFFSNRIIELFLGFGLLGDYFSFKTRLRYVIFNCNWSFWSWFSVFMNFRGKKAIVLFIYSCVFVVFEFSEISGYFLFSIAMRSFLLKHWFWSICLFLTSKLLLLDVSLWFLNFSPIASQLNFARLNWNIIPYTLSRSWNLFSNSSLRWFLVLMRVWRSAKIIVLHEVWELENKLFVLF